MNDKISQEETDNLLKEEPENKSGTPESSQDSPDDKNYEFITTEEADTLREISNIFMGSASKTLSTLLKTKVEITTPVVSEYKTIEDSFIKRQDQIVTEIEYIKGLAGTTILSLRVKDTAIIADLMMGGEGKPKEDKELGEIELSAAGEALNQTVGNAATSLSSMFNFPINISHPVIKHQKAEEKIELASDLMNVPIIAIKFKLIIGDLIDSEIIQFINVHSAKEQVKNLMNEMSKASENLAANTGDIESVAESALNKAQQTQTSPMPSAASPPPGQGQPLPQYPQSKQQVTVQPVEFASFDKVQNIYGEVNQNLNLVMDVKLELTVELGRTVVPIRNVLEFTRGSIIELDKVAGEPVELYANGKLIAKGEVVVIEDNFGLRIISIVSPENRVKDLQ